MGQSVTTKMPEGFSEYFTQKLAECIARGIVEKSIKTIHSRDAAIEIKNNDDEAQQPP